MKKSLLVFYLLLCGVIVGISSYNIYINNKIHKVLLKSSELITYSHNRNLTKIQQDSIAKLAQTVLNIIDSIKKERIDY